MAWKEIDEICASVENVMEYVMESVQKAHVEMPSEVRRHADALADEGRKCKAEIGRIDKEAALHRDGGIFRAIQKPKNMPDSTVFMQQVRAKMQERENSLPQERGKTAFLREEVRQEGKMLAKEVRKKYDEFAVKFKERGRKGR